MRYAVLLSVLLYPLSASALDEAKNIRIISDRHPDFYSTKTMVDTLTKGLKTDQEKVVAIYDFFRSMTYHLQYPEEKGAHVGTLKLLNVYGWTLCGGQASCLITLYQDAGYKTRYRGWTGHTTMEVFYDNAWHYVDSFLKYIAFRPDGTIASQEDINADPSIPLRLVKDDQREIMWYPEGKPDVNWTAEQWAKARPMLTCRDEKEGVVSGCKSSKVIDWGGTGTRDQDGYKTDINLRPGMSLKLRWEADPDGWYTAVGKEPAHSCGTRDFRNDCIIGPKLEAYGKGSYSNGDLVFEPNLTKSLIGFDQAGNDVYVVTMKSPFVVAHADIEAQGDGDLTIDVKSRLGESKALKPGKLPDEVVRGIYEYVVTIHTPKLTKLKIHSLIQHNRAARPFLLPGKNTWQVKADVAPKNAKLTLEVAYKNRQHTKSLKERWAQGNNLYDNKFAKEDANPTVVTKEVPANGASIDFDVKPDGTDDPAYPRMVYLLYKVE